MKYLILLISLFTLLQSCIHSQKDESSLINVTVDAMVEKPAMIGSSVYIENINENLTSLEKKYYTNILAEAFKLSGYNIATKPGDATYLIHFTQAITQKSKLVSKPITAWVPPQSYNVTSYNSQGYATTTVKQNGFGHVQFVGSGTEEETEYAQNLLVYCYESKIMLRNFMGKAKDDAMIWQMSLVSNEHFTDMKRFFPILAAAGARNFANPTMIKKTEIIDLSAAK